MKKIKTAVCIALCAAMTMTFSACSITDLFDKLVSGTKKVTETEDEANKRTEDDVLTADDTLAAPAFLNDISGTITVPAGDIVRIDGTAVIDDAEGELQYQWYSNNVNSNSGGTIIPDATDPVFVADTSEVSDVFYFVVAANSHGKTYNSATSGVREVVVRQRGEFTMDEFGGVRYLSADGSYPTLLWMVIDGNTYHFTDVGYVSTGWLEYEGKLYYFDEATAVLQRNATTPDGYQTDENGAMIVPPEEEAAEETAGEEGGGEEGGGEASGSEGQEGQE